MLAPDPAQSNTGESLRVERAITSAMFVMLGWFTVVATRTLLTSSEFSWDYGVGHRGVWYFADYSHGFVRRALVGAILEAVAGPQDFHAANVAAIVLAVGAWVFLLLLGVRLARLGRSQLEQLTLLTVVLSAPMYLSTLLHDITRLDSVGVIAGGVSVCLLLGRRIPLPLGVAATSVALTAAVATEEFLLAFLVAPVLFALWARVHSSRVRFISLVMTLVPASIVAIASVALPWSPRTASYVAARAGLPPTGSVGSPSWALSETPSDAMAFADSLGASQWVAVALSATGFLLVAATVLVVLEARARWWWLVVFQAGVAMAMGVVAVDTRRFWTLSLMAVLACVAILHRPSAVASSRRSGLVGALVCASLVFALLGQTLPLWGGEVPSWFAALSRSVIQ